VNGRNDNDSFRVSAKKPKLAFQHPCDSESGENHIIARKGSTEQVNGKLGLLVAFLSTLSAGIRDALAINERVRHALQTKAPSDKNSEWLKHS
jgi:hypothetical protein